MRVVIAPNQPKEELNQAARRGPLSKIPPFERCLRSPPKYPDSAGRASTIPKEKEKPGPPFGAAGNSEKGGSLLIPPPVDPPDGKHRLTGVELSRYTRQHSNTTQ
ncbi:hypothetical protein KM043_008127 [Ampulex compressa]|nr:hypothetical protein KM043_008127 [Ampulex compressa]